MREQREREKWIEGGGEEMVDIMRIVTRILALKFEGGFVRHTHRERERYDE